MKDLIGENGESFCQKDCATMREALKPFGVTDTGPVDDKNLYILEESATQEKILNVARSIRKRIKDAPEKKFLVVYVLAGHGMINNGKQILLLNEYSANLRFYKHWAIEEHIRNIAKNFENSYQIAFFACCREVKTQKHSGGFKN